MNRNNTNTRTAAQTKNTNRRRRQRGAGRRRSFRAWVLLFILGVLLVLSLTVFFKIESVYIVGTDIYDPVELAEASGVMPGDNLFRIDKEEISANLVNKYPYIDSVEISRKLPPVVEIQINQSIPGGAVKEGDEYVLITKDGKVLERGIMYIAEDVPLVIGLDTTGWQPGEYLGQWSRTAKPENETESQKNQREEADSQNKKKAEEVEKSLTTLSYLFEAIESSGFLNITNVDISDRLNIKIMYENRLLLDIGSEAYLAYKLELLNEIINKKLEPDERGILFAADAQNKKVIFRPVEGDIRNFGEKADDTQQELEESDTESGNEEPKQ